MPTGSRTTKVRRCSRNGCRWPASASLTYAYLKQVVWIEDLTPQPHPAVYDLCAAHAERLSVPVGWAKEDLRVIPPAVTPIRPGIEELRPVAAPPERPASWTGPADAQTGA
ncbi:MAG TPA: DUF3499 family protein [Actinomycetota bacterium]